MGLGLVLYLLICLLLIATSLLNQSQTGGLGILSGSSSSLLGTAHATFLSKVISFLAVIFFIGALFFSIISSGDRSVLDNLPVATPTEEAVPLLDDDLATPILDDDPPPSDLPTIQEEEILPLTPNPADQ